MQNRVGNDSLSTSSSSSSAPHSDPGTPVDFSELSSTLFDLKILQIDGSSFIIEEVSPEMTVLELKRKIWASKSIPSEQQKLICRGRVLLSFEKLEKYSLAHNDCIHLIIRPEPEPETNSNAADVPESASISNPTANTQTQTISLTAPSSARPAIGLSSANTNQVSRLLVQQLPSTNVRVAGSNLTTRRRATRRPGRLGRNFAVGDNVEHIYQALATLETLENSVKHKKSKNLSLQNDPLFSSSARSDGNVDLSGLLDFNNLDGVKGSKSKKSRSLFFFDESKEEKQTEDYDILAMKDEMLANRNAPLARKFEVGQWIDCRDTVNQWLEATVIELIEGGRDVRVHYNGWGTRWDEIISADSPRIARFRTKTKNSALCQNFSPTLDHWVSNTPLLQICKENSNDLNKLIPLVMEKLKDVSAEMKELQEGNLPYLQAVEGWTALSPKMDIIGRALTDLSAAIANRPHFRRRYETVRVPGSIVNFFRLSMLPFGFKACLEKDRDLNGSWNRRERSEILNMSRFDRGMLEMMPLAHEPHQSRSRGLELHVHTWIASEMRVGDDIQREDSAAADQDLELIEEVTDSMAQRILHEA